MEWRLGFRSDGSFFEELSSPHMTCSCGYEAGADASSSSSSEGSSSSSSSEGSSSSLGTTSSGSSGSSSIGSSQEAGGPGRFRAPGVCWGSDDAGCPRRMQVSVWVGAGPRVVC